MLLPLKKSLNKDRNGIYKNISLMPIAQQQNPGLSQAHGAMVLLIHSHPLHCTTPAWPGHAHWLYNERILQKPES